MYKSINLYYQKYGESENFEINEYLKANALLRSNISENSSDPKKMALAMLDRLAEKTDDYELNQSINKYFTKTVGTSKRQIWLFVQKCLKISRNIK